LEWSRDFCSNWMLKNSDSGVLTRRLTYRSLYLASSLAALWHTPVALDVQPAELYWIQRVRNFSPIQLAGLTGKASSGLSVEASDLAGARNVLKYIVTALASASLSPSAGILVSAFIACGFLSHR
jgi:hypothetical protein